jgi:methylated-DNA-[protein]-cysteine S-methyltransferase
MKKLFLEGNVMTDYAEYESPLGTLLLTAGARGVRGLYFEQHKYFKREPEWRRNPDNAWLTRAAKQLDEYFGGRRKHFELDLDLQGTVFQRAVWQELLAIPFGGTGTYMEHARRIGNPRAVRAVGSAIGRNPLSIIVPCHRVLATSGRLAGYAGGLERKRFLLALEAGSPN